ncbi:MAG: regulatory protein RecX [Candidatus Longimicrobiales bacterium M2_2A_002]
MKITRTKILGGSERVRLWVDGDDEPRAEIALDLFMRAGLAAGDELSAERLLELVGEDEAYRARHAAMNLLAHRARSRAELRRRLWRKEFPDPVIDRTLEWLEERDYLDDRAFAEAFVRDRLRLRPRGRFALIQELRRKGVDDAVAEAAIASVMDAEEVGERELALEAAEAWARKNRRSLRQARDSREDRLKARRRLYGHLARRGFRGDASRAAIAAILDDD